MQNDNDFYFCVDISRSGSAKVGVIQSNVGNKQAHIDLYFRGLRRVLG